MMLLAVKTNFARKIMRVATAKDAELFNVLVVLV